MSDWSQHADPGVQYYSGAALYRARFTLSPDVAASGSGARLYLDLGDVREIATPILNGRRLDTLWKTPFRVDISGAVRPGENTLEIETINLWPNRMIGDERMFPDDVEWIPRSMGEWSGYAMKHLPDWFEAWDAGRGERPTGRITFSNWKLFSADNPLLPSGLLGPVSILSVTRTEE